MTETHPTHSPPTGAQRLLAFLVPMVVASVAGILISALVLGNQLPTVLESCAANLDGPGFAGARAGSLVALFFLPFIGIQLLFHCHDQLVFVLLLMVVMPGFYLTHGFFWGLLSAWRGTMTRWGFAGLAALMVGHVAIAAVIGEDVKGQLTEAQIEEMRISHADLMTQARAGDLPIAEATRGDLLVVVARIATKAPWGAPLPECVERTIEIDYYDLVLYDATSKAFVYKIEALVPTERFAGAAHPAQAYLEQVERVDGAIRYPSLGYEACQEVVTRTQALSGAIR